MTEPAGQTPPSFGSQATSAPRFYRWLAFLAALLFALLIARHWHPIYHFTAFLQISEENNHPRIGAIQELPIYLHPGTASYDGQYYAQIAYDPTVTSPELPDAIDNVAWFALAAIARKLLRISDLRSFIAWAGLLFSAGALHSVRFALTDLVALVFFAAAFLALEFRRTALATGLLALGGLGRETNLAAAPAL